MTIEIEIPDGESASLDFKSCFDPESKQDWCENAASAWAIT